MMSKKNLRVLESKYRSLYLRWQHAQVKLKKQLVLNLASLSFTTFFYLRNDLLANIYK